MKLLNKVQIKNNMGLHTRPATEIVKLLQNRKSQVHFIYKTAKVDAKSILNLLMLTAKKNSWITIEVEGEDAESTMDELLKAFDNRFGE